MPAYDVMVAFYNGDCEWIEVTAINRIDAERFAENLSMIEEVLEVRER